MGFSVKDINDEDVGNYISVKFASQYSGYSEQYIRRLLRNRILKTNRIGQIWLIEKTGFEKYLLEAKKSSDKRCGPQISGT